MSKTNITTTRNTATVTCDMGKNMYGQTCVHVATRVSAKRRWIITLFGTFSNYYATIRSSATPEQVEAFLLAETPEGGGASPETCKFLDYRVES
jgi:uncharacterized protein (UPF0262 family)